METVDTKKLSDCINLSLMETVDTNRQTNRQTNKHTLDSVGVSICLSIGGFIKENKNKSSIVEA